MEKGVKSLRAAASAAKDMDDDEVTNLEAICWNVSPLNSAWASCLITTTTGEVGTLVRARIPRIWIQSMLGAEQMVLTKVSC